MVSNPGETYEQWRERTAPAHPVTPVNTRLWDWAVIVLLGLFFVWIGGTARWIGLGLVVVLVAEQLLQRSDHPADGAPALLSRGLTLLVTLVLSAWLVSVVGVEAAPLPLLLVLLDVKDERSFLRWAYEGVRRKLGR